MSRRCCEFTRQHAGWIYERGESNIQSLKWVHLLIWQESHELPRSRSQVDVEATHDDKTRSTFSPKYSPKYSNSGADDQTRSANGRTLMAIKGEGSGDWQELHSKTSLI